MRKYKTITKTYESKELVKCVCDICNKECQCTETEYRNIDESFQIQFKCKYADNEYIQFDLCPECAKKLLKQFLQTKQLLDFNETVEMWERID